MSAPKRESNVEVGGWQRVSTHFVFMLKNTMLLNVARNIAACRIEHNITVANVYWMMW